jgi:hypothetical protein
VDVEAGVAPGENAFRPFRAQAGKPLESERNTAIFLSSRTACF